MQTDHRVPTRNPTVVRQQSYHKRPFPGANPRKRDRHDLICVVCHAPAMGYNFDQITCESCKAFFRRNALNNADKFKCRSGNDDCVITLETRKRCKACRLKKCFVKGLRKEWIMSDEEKRTKKQKIEDNRRLRALSQNSNLSSVQSITPSSSPSIVPETEHLNFSMDYSTNLNDDDDDDDNYDDAFRAVDSNSYSTSEELCHKPTAEPPFDYKTSLATDDRLLLTKVEDSYTRAIRLNISVINGYDYPCLRNLHDITDLINEIAQMSTLRMITYFKLTPEFNSLHEDDRLALVKHNLMAIFYLHLCICTDLSTGIYCEPQMNNDLCYHANELRFFSDEIYQQAMTFIQEIQQLSSMDHTIIKLLILVMIFSKGSDLNESVWLETEHIFQAQNVYIKLLWKYLDIRFGSDQTASIFSRLIFSSMKAQVLGRQTKETVTRHILNSRSLAPLMQSVLLIS